jgi:hypothetical protein
MYRCGEGDDQSRAFAALEEECKTLEMRHLEGAALSMAQASKLLDEALDGEDKLMDEEEETQTLEHRLWVQDNPRTAIKIVKKNGDVKPASPKPKPRSVGVRNQKRDAVGAGRKYA